MPTYGWIQEDSIEAFLAGTESVPGGAGVVKPVFSCPFCVDYFDSRKILQSHISSAHRTERPKIIIEGKEPETVSIIRADIETDSIILANTTEIKISINGGSLQSIEPNVLAKKLSDLKQGEVKVELLNAAQAKAAPVASFYKFSIRIAKPEELREVEKAFSGVVMSTEISRQSIQRFLDHPGITKGGEEYAKALAEYCLGVLLKERPESETLTTGFSRYREVYGSALGGLVDYKRPLAVLVVAIIRFAMNDFSQPLRETGFWELDLANAVFNKPHIETLAAFKSEGVQRKPVCPVDHGTGQILDLAARMFRQNRWSTILDDECRKAATSDILDVHDRQKALAIWALAAWRLGAKKNARESLLQIAETYPFSIWAQEWLESAA